MKELFLEGLESAKHVGSIAIAPGAAAVNKIKEIDLSTITDSKISK